MTTEIEKLRGELAEHMQKMYYAAHHLTSFAKDECSDQKKYGRRYWFELGIRMETLASSVDKFSNTEMYLDKALREERDNTPVLEPKKPRRKKAKEAPKANAITSYLTEQDDPDHPLHDDDNAVTTTYPLPKKKRKKAK